jgi:sugar phosphate isomerase/epimerase
VRLAFSTLGCPHWSLARAAEEAARCGYQGLELRVIDGQLVSPALTQQERAAALEAVRAAGITVCAVDSSLRLMSCTEAELRAHLELCSQWGAPVLRVFGGAWAEDGRDDAFERARQLLAGVAPDAERLGVRLAVETHDAFASAAAVAELLGPLPPTCAALWDTLHPHRVGETPDQVWELLGTRLAHVHVKDARRTPDGWELCLLGEGEVPVRAILELLRRHHYQGWVAVEWEKKWHPEIPGPEVALPQHSAVLGPWLEG